MAVGRQQIIMVGSSHQIMVMGSWAPKAKALAINSQLTLMGLKSRKRTQLQSRVGHTQVHSLCRCWQLVDCILQVSGCFVTHGKYFYIFFRLVLLRCTAHLLYSMAWHHCSNFSSSGLRPCIQECAERLWDGWHPHADSKPCQRKRFWPWSFKCEAYSQV
jgi:hypothetical protein